jgi:release factor glutamine methyltransferase
LRQLAVYGREPDLALDGGPDGLDLIRRLIAQISTRLAGDGLALFEIEAGQGPAVITLAQAAFPGGDVRLRQDYSGRDRLVEITPRPA